MPGSPDWDARTYHQVATPQEAWARQILSRLPLQGHETVLDAGCGSGRATRFLLDRLPHGRVFGVDLSPAMLQVARESLAPFSERVELVLGDLSTVSLPVLVDGIFSNATFHWILDHAALFANLARLLRTDGWLLAQCGGRGNIAAVHAQAKDITRRPPYAAHFAVPLNVWRYAGAEETAERLREAGFDDVETGLEASPQGFLNREAYALYLRTVILRPFLNRLPRALHEDYVEAVVTAIERQGGGYVVDYVRLNLRARRR